CRCAGKELEPEAIKGKTPDATVEMEEVQAAFIGSGAGGKGVLSFRGQQYPFRVGGVGVGGVGLSTVDASGEVYNLRELSQFPGTYGQARYGFAIGTSSAGELWMQNGVGRDPALEGEANRAHLEPRGRRRADFDEPLRCARGEVLRCATGLDAMARASSTASRGGDDLSGC